jgi:prepilin-type N-terminal cleavage/methylation domain-containing protein
MRSSIIKCDGFSLIEMVMVLIIISIISIVVMTTYPGSVINVAAQADQLMGDIRYTQSLSKHRGQRYRINFAADRYWISSADGATVYSHPASGANIIFLNNGITLGTTNAFLVFDANAVPYTNTATPWTALAADAVVTLTAGADTRTVRISPETGRLITQ